MVDSLEFNMSTEDAVWKEKFPHQWLPDEISIEWVIPETTREALRKMGYTLKERGPIGRTEVIKLLYDKKIEAVADVRGDDSAEGY